jgi:hypothetical protein
MGFGAARELNLHYLTDTGRIKTTGDYPEPV